MPRIEETERGLKAIAATGGEPHLIDTPAELEQAQKLISKMIRESWNDPCAASILAEAGKLLLVKDARLQVNPLFDDLLVRRCGGFTLGKRFMTLNPNVFVIELLSHMDAKDHSSFLSSTNKGMMLEFSRVAVSAGEWDWITEPLALLAQSDQKCHLPGTYEASLRAQNERDALKSTVARFEQVIGPKAGTSADIGGSRGNTIIENEQEAIWDHKNLRSNRNVRGQQDCVSEAITTRGLIELLVRQGLLLFHEMTPEDGLAVLPHKVLRNLHTAVLMFDPSSGAKEPWVVDSWPRDNGELPDIWPLQFWTEHWSRNISR